MLEETALTVSTEQSWLGASLDCVRKCKCCEPRVVEIKCPYTGRDLDPKAAFLSDNVGGTCSADGQTELRNSHPYYYQVQTQMAVSGLKSCDFVIYTNIGIYIVEIDFNKQFWDDVISKVSIFYESKIIPALLLQLSSQSLESSQTKSDKSNKSDDPNTQACQPSIENNCSDGQFRDIASDDSIMETEHQNSEQSSSVENNCSDGQFRDIASDDSITETEHQNSEQSSSIENNCSDGQFRDIASDDSITETEHQNSEQSSSIENNCSDDSNIKSECYNTKLGLSEMEFLKREDTTKTLKNFIDSGCGDIRQFSSRKVTFDVINVMKNIVNNDGERG